MNFLRAHPLVLFAAYIGAGHLGGLVVDRLSYDASIPLTLFLALVVPLGWSLFVALGLSKAFPGKVQVSGGWLMTAVLFCNLGLIAAFYSLKADADNGDPALPFAHLLAIAAIGAMLYVYLVAAESLVDADWGRKAGFLRRGAIFLAFFFFPFGIFYIQYRLRRLLPPSRAEFLNPGKQNRGD